MLHLLVLHALLKLRQNPYIVTIQQFQFTHLSHLDTTHQHTLQIIIIVNIQLHIIMIPPSHMSHSFMNLESSVTKLLISVKKLKRLHKKYTQLLKRSKMMSLKLKCKLSILLPKTLQRSMRLRMCSVMPSVPLRKNLVLLKLMEILNLFLPQ